MLCVIFSCLVLLLIILIIILCKVLENYFTELREREFEESEYYKQTNNSLQQIMLDKGKKGEYLTYNELTLVTGYKKFILNAYIPTKNGETTEIDIIMIHETGLYIFESKNFSGWIYGTDTENEWVQILSNGRKIQKNYFFNPIIQNRQHMKWLGHYLSDVLPMFSFIVFSDRCVLREINSTGSRNFVVNRFELLDKVKDVISSNKSTLSKSNIDVLYEVLYPLTQVSEEVKNEHIRQVNKKIYGNKNNSVDLLLQSKSVYGKICPRCGSRLVIRTARRGKNIGNKFWGCSSYPKCRYTDDIK